MRTLTAMELECVAGGQSAPPPSEPKPAHGGGVVGPGPDGVGIGQTAGRALDNPGDTIGEMLDDLILDDFAAWLANMRKKMDRTEEPDQVSPDTNTQTPGSPGTPSHEAGLRPLRPN